MFSKHKLFHKNDDEMHKIQETVGNWFRLTASCAVEDGTAPITVSSICDPGFELLLGKWQCPFIQVITESLRAHYVCRVHNSYYLLMSLLPCTNLALTC